MMFKKEEGFNQIEEEEHSKCEMMRTPNEIDMDMYANEKESSPEIDRSLLSLQKNTHNTTFETIENKSMIDNSNEKSLVEEGNRLTRKKKRSIKK